VIVEKAQHPEVEAIRSYVPERVDVMEDVEAIQGLDRWDE
jgi:4-hydroxy-3-methylbut-2-enyl diphosphate reductase IspH